MKRPVKLGLIIAGAVVAVAGVTAAILFAVAPREEVATPAPSLVDVLTEQIPEEREFLEYVGENYPGALGSLTELLETTEYDRGLWHRATGYSYIVLTDFWENKYTSMDNVKIIEADGPDYTLSFTGDVSLADNWHIAPKYDERGGILGILGETMLETMKGSTFLAVNSEFTVSNRGTALSGKMYTFRARPERLLIYDEMGVDLATLANNHVYDYGMDAFLDMLEAFETYGIPHIGAGRNLAEASKPYFFIIGGYKFAFLSATRAEKNVMTPAATAESPGTFWCYDPTDVINAIKSLDGEVDFIVPIIHFGRENSHLLEDEQVASAHAYIEAGADVVVGHHAHVLQGVEFYEGKPIIYNLGNFLFNYVETDTALFQIVMDEEGKMDYYILPALQIDSRTILLEEGARKQQIINDINSWSVNARLDEAGKMSEVGA